MEISFSFKSFKIDGVNDNPKYNSWELHVVLGKKSFELFNLIGSGNSGKRLWDRYGLIIWNDSDFTRKIYPARLRGPAD